MSELARNDHGDEWTAYALRDTTNDGSDFVTFQMSVNAISPALVETTETSQSTYPDGTGGTIKVNEHRDYISSYGTGSLTLTSRRFGAIPVAGLAFSVYSARDHTVAISKQ
jgi:hypothetical protein